MDVKPVRIFPVDKGGANVIIPPYTPMAHEIRYARGHKRGPKKKRGPKPKAPPVSSRKPNVKVAEKRTVLAAALAAGASEKTALTMAGYSPTSAVVKNPEVKSGVAELREKLRVVEGYTFEDSAGFYKGISEDEENRAADRIKARARMDSLLGYDAPQHVEINEKKDLRVLAVQLSNMPVSPAELMAALEGKVENGVSGPRTVSAAVGNNSFRPADGGGLSEGVLE